MSVTVLWIMCAVIVAALAVWLFMVHLADRDPAFRRPHIEPRRGRVQGGTHVGGGRSVSPHRDAEIIPDENPEKPTIPVARRRGTSPMDL